MAKYRVLIEQHKDGTKSYFPQKSLNFILFKIWIKIEVMIGPGGFTDVNYSTMDEAIDYINQCVSNEKKKEGKEVIDTEKRYIKLI